MADMEYSDGKVWLITGHDYNDRVEINEPGVILQHATGVQWFPESTHEILSESTPEELRLRVVDSHGTVHNFDLRYYDVTRYYRTPLGSLVGKAPWVPGDPTTTPAEERIRMAVTFAESYGQIDGSHHRVWVIDQMVRSLLENDYDAWVETYEEDGEYEWDTGIAP